MSRGQRVLQEINQIRSALRQQNYRIHKYPKQAVWAIKHTNGASYRLTYQPAPINAWSLHPPDKEASQLLGLIDRALTSQPLTNSGRVA